jgi:hypothetical protein
MLCIDQDIEVLNLRRLYTFSLWKEVAIWPPDLRRDITDMYYEIIRTFKNLKVLGLLSTSNSELRAGGGAIKDEVPDEVMGLVENAKKGFVQSTQDREFWDRLDVEVVEEKAFCTRRKCGGCCLGILGIGKLNDVNSSVLRMG